MAISVDRLPLSVPVKDVKNLDTGQKIMAYWMREQQLVGIVNSLAFLTWYQLKMRRVDKHSAYLEALKGYDAKLQRTEKARTDLNMLLGMVQHKGEKWNLNKLWKRALGILDKGSYKPVPDTLAMAFRGEGDYA